MSRLREGIPAVHGDGEEVNAPANPPQPRDSSARRPFGDGAPDGGNPFSALPNQAPPQNLEAEEAVLGGILLDPEAMARVADILQPDAFYVAAHRQIFRTALTSGAEDFFHQQGTPPGGTGSRGGNPHQHL